MEVPKGTHELLVDVNCVRSARWRWMNWIWRKVAWSSGFFRVWWAWNKTNRLRLSWRYWRIWRWRRCVRLTGCCSTFEHSYGITSNKVHSIAYQCKSKSYGTEIDDWPSDYHPITVGKAKLCHAEFFKKNMKFIMSKYVLQRQKIPNGCEKCKE